MGTGEFAFIEWLRRQQHLDPARVPVGPGDDCAVVAVDDRRVLFATDIFLEGTHFRLAETEPFLVGRKAMAANLSDLAAMAGLPRAAVVSVGLPATGGRSLAEAIYRGLASVADRHGCPVVGGDVAVWPRGAGGLTVSVAVMGEPAGIEPVLRRGAQVGDVILVTGRLGGSRLGRHLTFEPRVVEARALATTVPIHAMIDVSDGLSSDLAHVCRESGVGALVRATDIPVHEDAVMAADRSGRTPLAHALHDGEDFELLFTTDAESARRLCADPPVGVPLTVIGEIIAEGLLIESEAGGRTPLVPEGYEHHVGE